jgi:hypothetical protein
MGPCFFLTSSWVSKFFFLFTLPLLYRRRRVWFFFYTLCVISELFNESHSGYGLFHSGRRTYLVRVLWRHTTLTFLTILLMGQFFFVVQNSPLSCPWVISSLQTL